MPWELAQGAPGKEVWMGSANLDPVSRSYPAQYVSSWTMKYGTPVTIRPIRPEDEPLMVNFHKTLSDRTVYLRYFSSLSLSRRTAHERLFRICTCDYQTEIVLVAEHRNPQTAESQILGVARLNKLATNNEAEVAGLVSDQYQHQGLGSELLRQLIKVAQEEKLSCLRAEMLRDNFPIQIIFKRLGFRLRLLGDSASVQAILDL